MKRKTLFSIIFTILLFIMVYPRLVTRKYNIKTKKVDKLIKLILISDLHGDNYGKNQQRLIKQIDRLNPDAVLLAGDIFDDKNSFKNTKNFLKQIKHPCFYVTGNHEVRTHKLFEIKNYLKESGICVLDGKNTVLDVKGEKINICGADDPQTGNFKRQIKQAFNGINNDNYTVLISHRPERFEQYMKLNADLTVCGHAHGGQWRIPFFINGLYAPYQGMMPKYAGGIYGENGKNMIVSRGLSKSRPLFPRIFNPPEIVLIEIDSCK